MTNNVNIFLILKYILSYIQDQLRQNYSLFHSFFAYIFLIHNCVCVRARAF